MSRGTDAQREALRETQRYLDMVESLLNRTSTKKPMPPFAEMRDSISKLQATLDVFDEEYQRMERLLKQGLEALSK